MSAEIVQHPGMTIVPSLGREQLDLLKRTIARDLDDNEFALFAQVCQRTGLDPFMKQVHAVKRWSKRVGRQVMSIQVGIDGYRLIADRTGKYAGNDDPIFVEGNPFPQQATVTVYKLVGGTRCPFTATARWSEYCPGDKQDAMWKRMPHVMLGKVAEALALRKAFPAELSGLYTDEEMDQAGVIDLPPAEPTVSKEDVDLLHACVEELEADKRSAFLAWKSEQSFSWPWTVADYEAMNDKLEEIATAAPVEAASSEASEDPHGLASELPVAAVASDPGSGEEGVTSSPLSSPTSPEPEYTEDEMAPFDV